MFRSWGEQNATMSLLCLLIQKDLEIPSSLIEILVNSLTDDNHFLRKVLQINFKKIFNFF